MNQSSAIYNDFSGLANLKARAAQEAPEATREAARQFEALFVQMMLKSMRSAGAVLGEQGDKTYEEMFDKQIAMEMTQERGIGIADMLMRQLDTTAPAGEESDSALPVNNRFSPRYVEMPEVSPSRNDWRPADQDSFVRDVWPHAQDAARELDIDPRTLIAQAALETGWGQKLIRDGSGISGNNLFGIKADHRWGGEKLAVNTIEFDQGLPQVLRDNFRAYSNVADSFKDYVNFLQSNPRYQDVTQGGLSPKDYASSLQSAGYATDPNYAQKITEIVNSPRLNALIDGLKIGGDESIYL